MLSFEVDEARGFIEIIVDGPVTSEDYQSVAAAIDALLRTHRKILALEIIRSIGWISPAVWWHDATFFLRHGLAFCERCAVVTDHRWIGPVVRAAGAILPTELRVFGEAQLEQARAWTNEVEQPAAA